MSAGTTVRCGAEDCIYNVNEECSRDEINLYMVDMIYKGCDDFEQDETDDDEADPGSNE